MFKAFFVEQHSKSEVVIPNYNLVEKFFVRSSSMVVVRVEPRKLGVYRD